jgi:hypothetical protein
MKKTKVALAPFLSSCSAVTTLGIRACLGDYSEEDRQLLSRADCVFFPTIRFVDIFQAIGKTTFPSPASYRYPRTRVLQETLFQYMKLPHPRRRIYFGAGQKQHIVGESVFPLLVMGPGMHADSVHLVHDHDELEVCLPRHNPVLVQDYVEWKERVRLVFVRFELAGALRRVGSGSRPGSFEPLPFSHPMLESTIHVSLGFLKQIQLDDTMVEWGLGPDGWQLISIARPPARWPTTTGIVDHHILIRDLIQRGVL